MSFSLPEDCVAGSRRLCDSIHNLHLQYENKTNIHAERLGMEGLVEIVNCEVRRVVGSVMGECSGSALGRKEDLGFRREPET